jgi:hypothetical protein
VISQRNSTFSGVIQIHLAPFHRRDELKRCIYQSDTKRFGFVCLSPPSSTDTLVYPEERKTCADEARTASIR